MASFGRGARGPRAQCWYQHDRFADALAAADHVLVLEPANVVALQVRAIALADLGRHAEAEGCARQVMALAPDDADSPLVLATVLLKANPESVLDEMNDLVRRDHGPTTLAIRSMVRTELGDANGTAADATEAAALDPEHEMAALVAVVAAVVVEDWDEVIRRADLPVTRDNLNTNFGVAVRIRPSAATRMPSVRCSPHSTSSRRTSTC